MIDKNHSIVRVTLIKTNCKDKPGLGGVLWGEGGLTTPSLSRCDHNISS